MRFSSRIFLFLIIPYLSLAQETISPLVPPNELETSLQNIMNHLSTVTLEKVRYEQTLTYEKSRPYMVTVEINEFKGKKVLSYRYQFNMANIDQDRIDYSQKKTHYEVKLTSKEKQKFILPFKGAKQENYTQSITIYAIDSENAQSLQAGFRSAIPQAGEQVNEKVELLNLDRGMEWLAEHIDNVRIGKNFFQQSFKRGEEVSTQIFLGLDESETIVNLADLNPNTITIDVQGKKLFVSGQTDDKVDFITDNKKGTLKGYSNKFSLMVETVEEGKLVVDAIQQMIPWAREEIRKYVPVVNSREEGLALLKEHIGTGIEGGNKVVQSFEANCIAELSLMRSAKKAPTSERVKFNFNDLDDQKLDISISGKTITLDMVTQDKQMLFQSFINDAFENYSHKQVIYASDVENARYLQQLIPKVIANCKTDLAMKGSFGSEEAFQWIFDQTKTIKTPTATYHQSMVHDETNTCEWTFTQKVEKSKKTVVHEYIFKLDQLEEESVDFKISSKELAVEIPSLRRQKAIEHGQDDGKGSPSVNSFLLVMEDIETARQMIEVWKQAIEGCK